MTKEIVAPIKTKTNTYKVFVTSAYTDTHPISTFLEFTKLDKIKSHQVISDPEQADIILFIENSRYEEDHFFSKLKSHNLVKKYPDKVFMYNSHDMPWFVLPGLYTCIPKKQFDYNHMSAGPYIEVVNDYIQCDFSKTPKYLYSFFGARSSDIRRKLFNIKHHPRSIMLETAQHIFYGGNRPKSPQVQYAELMSDSKFVLAPKGIGTSSVRLFEILRAGRIPVVISDNLVLPPGPDWNKCSVQVLESEVDKIPEILEKHEASWPENSKVARKAYEDFFAPDTIFNYFIDSIGKLKKTSSTTPRLGYRNTIAYYRYVNRKLVIENIKVVLNFLKSKVKGA